MSPRPKILVTGSTGQLGSELKHIQGKYQGLDLKFSTSKELNITDKESVKRYLAHSSPDYIINCAAYTKVDLAEDDEDMAFDVNKQGVKYLAEYCKSNNTFLFHISTDYVYNSTDHIPIVETATTDPQSVYAKSKLLGEKILLDYLPNQSMIIRTSWLYSVYGNNFVKTMLRLAHQGKKLKIVDDQYGCPTNARDLAEVILNIITGTASGDFDLKSGIYNYCNMGMTNWFTFAKTIFKLKNIDVDIQRIDTKNFAAKAERPAWSVLNTDKIQSHYRITIPEWEKSLANCLSELG